MSLLVVWLHVLGVVVWLGGLMYQAHVLMPAAKRGQIQPFAEAAARGRAAGWVALALVVLTGLYNVTQLGPVEQVMRSGAGLLLAGKFMLVLVLIALAGQRDFSYVPRLGRALGGIEDPKPVLRTIAVLDHVAVLLGVVIVYLGLAVSRR